MISSRDLPRILSRHACGLAGACAVFLAGWFGLLAGLLIGTMLDVARFETRARRSIAVYLEKLEGEPPFGPFAGYPEAVCLALRGDWIGPADMEVRRGLWASLEAASLARMPNRHGPELVVDVASRTMRADLPGLARKLATGGAPQARRLLADWAFALAALGGGLLDAKAELRLRAALGDCGVGFEDILAARARAFPGRRDPWTVLGLAPGAPRAEVKRAYRRLSRALHPDAAPGDDGERFRELGEAYAELRSFSGERDAR